MEAYVENLTASMTKDGVAYRSISKTSAAASEVMAIANGKTYVPQGDYAIEYTYKLNGVAETKTVNVTVPAPEFTGSASAYTSYSKYLEGAVDAANACTAESVYDIRLSVSISEAVLAQVPMTSNKGTIYNADGSSYVAVSNQSPSSPVFYTLPELADCPWGSYTLNAEATFDGVTATSPTQTLHITGLPYKTPSMVEEDWDFSSWNCEYSNGTIKLGGVSGSGECTATSKMAFCVPEPVNIRINTNATVRAHDMRVNIFGNLVGVCNQTTFTVSVNGNQIISQNSDYQDNNDTGKNYDLTGISTISPSSYSIKMNSSYTLAGPWSKVHSMEILYR